MGNMTDVEMMEAEVANEVEVERSYPTPRFTSDSSHLLVNEGGTVRLPCLVDMLEGFVLLWKKGTSILTVQYQVIDQRYRLEDLDTSGNYLIISQLTPEDAGSYTCQISAYKPTTISHNVTVRTEPIISLGQGPEVTVTEGGTLSLDCKLVSGSPSPSLRWVFSGPEDSDAADIDINSHVTRSNDGHTLTLDIGDIERSQAGQYSCTADNGFHATPVTKMVDVKVAYPPSIQIEEAFIVSDMAEEQKLVCSVTSYPPVVELDWSHDGLPLTEDSPGVEVVTSVVPPSTVSTLTIMAVNSSSTGEYTCTATNSVGSDSRTAVVSGEADPVTILTQSGDAEEEDKFTLDWVVASRSPVTSWVLGLRVAGTGDEGWEYMEVELDAGDNSTDTLDAVDRGDGKYGGQMELTGLQPDTKYEVTIATSNSFGLGQHGDIFSFTTNQTVTTTTTTTEMTTQEADYDEVTVQGNVSVKTSSADRVSAHTAASVLVILLAIACLVN